MKESVNTDINCYHCIAKERRKSCFKYFPRFYLYPQCHLLMLTPHAVDKQPYGPSQDETAINKLQQNGSSAVSTTS